MRKDKSIKTYGRHRNRVISPDLWSSDNEKKRNGVFSTSSELDSTNHSSSMFPVSGTSDTRSKLNSSGNSADVSDFVPVVRKSTRITKEGRKKAAAKANAESRTSEPWLFSQKAPSSSTDSSYASEKAVKTRPRNLREPKKNIDYNCSAQNQLHGTKAKRKRPVKTVNDKENRNGDALNFSEFDDYSLVITDASIKDGGLANTNKQIVMETSTPVAKRTRHKDVSLDRIKNSDISHIEHIDSPVTECGMSGYSIHTPESIYSSQGNLLFSSPSIVSSVPSLGNISDDKRSRSGSYLGHNSGTGRAVGQRVTTTSELVNNIDSPDEPVIQIERLRNSFILRHVHGRKKSDKNKSDHMEEVAAKSPENAIVQLSDRLSESFVAMHISNNDGQSSKSTKSDRTQHESNADNSASLFDSPGSNLRNNLSSMVANLRKNKLSDVNSTSESVDYGDEVNHDSAELNSTEEDVDEQTDSSGSSTNLSAIIEYEETDDDEEDDDDDDDDDSDDDEDNDDVLEESECDASTENVENVSTFSNTEEMETSACQSDTFSGTLYLLNDNSSETNSRSEQLFASDGSELPRGRRVSPGSNCNSAGSSRSKTDNQAASEEEEGTESEDESEESSDSSDEDIENNAPVNTYATPEPDRNVRRLRDKHLDALHNSFSEMLTPTKQRGSLVPMSAQAKILLLCEQLEPVTFKHSIPARMMSKCKKIGEGVYGEVFRSLNKTRSVALKIIPIEGDFAVNDEPQKKFEEILPEVVIAKELCALRENKQSMTSNFCEVYTISLVKGKYPAPLLREWDLFHKSKGSENDRPDVFKDNQLFMIFEFADCGSDLESYKFESLEQAKSVLTQVAYSLAVAEESLQFEHRDLHWGNVLVRPTTREDIHFRLCGNLCTVPTLGVEANTIDFTLSRLTKDGCTVYTDLANDDSLFTGEGDYQFDIYRKMKEENRNDWKAFHSRTNIFWIHYLANKLIYFKTYPSEKSRQHRDCIRQCRQFLSTILDYNSAIELVIDSLFLNS